MIKLNEVLVEDFNTILKYGLKLIKQEQPQFIINFAAQSMVAESWHHPEDWFMTNAVSTTKLFNKLRNFNFIKKICSHNNTRSIWFLLRLY